MVSRSTLIAGLAASLLFVPGQAMARTQIRAVGSSTVYPFATAVAERFARANPKFGAPIIESTGTGAGMKLFCAGVGQQFPDIENASRRIKASEVKQCAANGVSQITEIQIGLDGIALATAKQSPLAGLTQRDVYVALAKTPFGKPNKTKTWKDVNAKLPAIPIRVYGPPPTSGTRDALGELLMTPPCQANPAMAALKKSDENKFKAVCTAVREDGAYVETGENDNLIVQKIEASPGAIGIFGYSYLEENMDKLRGVSINGITPTYDSIASFKYPGARPLYIYVKNAHVRAIPAIRAYVAEFTRETTWGKGGYLARRGLIAAPDAIRAKSAAAAQAMTPLDPATVK
jgi:phosphate transport system substrate-binding protein